MRMGDKFRRVISATVLAVASLGVAWTAGGQTVMPCGADVIDSIGTETGKPFTAERVIQSVMRAADGSEKTTEFTEFVARDSAGRFRVEKRGTKDLARSDAKVTLNTREGGTISTTQTELGIVTMIFDFTSGKVIQLQPGMQIARVTECATGSRAKQGERPYSSYFSTLANKQLPPNVTFEDLGMKEIDGISVRGYRTVQREPEDDSEWKGRAGISEVWVSDDLAATMLEIKSDLEKTSEGRTRLTNVKREEPDAALFEIPAGYTVNSQELPYRMDHKN